MVRQRIADKHQVKRVVAALIVLVLGIVASGCSSELHHSIISKVFDGVPPYVSPEERARIAAEEQRMEEEYEAQERFRLTRRYQPVKRSVQFIHGPRASKECTRCHDLSTSSGFGREKVRKVAEGKAAGGRLRMPMQELCVHCHTDVIPESSPESEKLWVHGPVAAGWCVFCHAPHQSRFPFLLKSGTSASVCGACHRREDLVAFTEEHRPLSPEEGYPPLPKNKKRKRASEAQEDEAQDSEDSQNSQEVVAFVQVVKDCTRCHDPHTGPDHRLLREKQRVQVVPQEDEEYRRYEEQQQARASSENEERRLP